MLTDISYQMIEKEDLVNINFSKNDALVDDTARRLRNIYLKKAELLGNGYKNKVKMVFKTESGDHLAVETTIWYVNEDFISLKAGISIPTKSVCDIEF